MMTKTMLIEDWQLSVVYRVVGQVDPTEIFDMVLTKDDRRIMIEERHGDFYVTVDDAQKQRMSVNELDSTLRIVCALGDYQLAEDYFNYEQLHSAWDEGKHCDACGEFRIPAAKGPDGIIVCEECNDKVKDDITYDQWMK